MQQVHPCLFVEKFTEKAPIGFFIFLAGAMMVYVLIIACVLYREWPFEILIRLIV